MITARRATPSRERARRERARRERLAPTGSRALLVDLLAAALSAGSSPSHALQAVVDALPADEVAPLRPVAATLWLGAEPSSAWAGLLDDDGLRPLAVAMTRSSTSGTHAADLLGSLADEMRRQHRLAATEAARRAGVRAVLPLGVCFLPAFVLLGVVPTLVGLAGSVLVAR